MITRRNFLIGTTVSVIAIPAFCKEVVPCPRTKDTAYGMHRTNCIVNDETEFYTECSAVW